MKLKDNSYMDVKSYFDIEINLNDENEEKLFNNLVDFYQLHEKSKKWHKRDYYQNIELNETKETLEKLKEYYVNCYLEMEKIKRLTDKEEERLDEDEKLLYLKELRLYDDEKLNSTSIEKQEQLNPFLQKLMSLTRIASNIKVRVINKKLPENLENRPIIFTLSHVGKDDQIVFNEAVTKHYTILSGDYESLHNNVEGIVTKLNGVIFFDMNSKNERNTVIERVSEKLKSGDNILCSMEAAWNISSNSLVNPLFTGMIEAALLSDALILPVAIERFNSKLFSIDVSDKFFDPKKFFKDREKNKDNMKLLAEEIRQKLADMKFNSYFDSYIYPRIQAKRKTIGDFDKANENFKHDILKKWTFDEDDIRRKGYRDKENPIYVYRYIIDKLNFEKSRINEMTQEEYTKFINELINEVENPVYPNEIHNELSEILDSIRIDKRIR